MCLDIRLPEETAPRRESIGITLEQSRRNEQFHLYYGPHWMNYNSRTPVLSHPAYHNFKELLMENGYPPKDKGWMHIISTGYRIQTDAFLIKMVKEGESFIDQLAGDMWAFFEVCAERMEAVNMAVLGRSG